MIGRSRGLRGLYLFWFGEGSGMLLEGTLEQLFFS